MNKLLLILILAVTVEALIKYFKTIAKGLVKGEWKNAVTQILAITLSITVCYLTNTDLYVILGVTFSCPIFGVIMTGIFTSRGANYVF